jgi:hypothetical protein
VQQHLRDGGRTDTIERAHARPKTRRRERAREREKEQKQREREGPYRKAYDHLVALQVLLSPGPPMWPMWLSRTANPRKVRARYAQTSRKVGCKLWLGAPFL